MFIIEDELHGSQVGEYASLTEAIAELQRRAALPYEPPNVAPCTSSRTCGLRYEIIEYDTSFTPWKELQRIPYLEVTVDGAKWLHPPGSQPR